jgi:ornithine lipid ester-linked acyl 2-hydroxylase
MQRNKAMYRLISFLGKLTIDFLEAIIRKTVVNRYVFPANEFEWTAKLMSKFPLILNEYQNIQLAHQLKDITEISEEQNSVVDKQEWDFLPFYIYGNAIDENLKLCPNTTSCLAEIPNVTTAFFSVLKPQTFVKEHRGAFKGYLRLLMGVRIPEPNIQCGLKIKNEIYHWENGKCMIFDDTFLHEAWNNSNEERVVLYVDFIRPMPKILMLAAKAVTWLISASPYVQNSLKKLKMAYGSDKSAGA